MQFNLADLFESFAAAFPDRVALVSGNTRLTYAQLDERGTRLANHWRAHGIGPGDHVGLYLFNGHEYVEAMLAAFKLRARTVNVNYRYVAEELRYLLNDAGAKAIVFHSAFADRLAEVPPDLPELTVLLQVDDGSAAALADARSRGVTVVATCPYMKRYLERHPES